VSADLTILPADARVDVAASDKQQLLRELARQAAAKLGLDETALADELFNREAVGSTGVGRGVAIPHARLPAVRQPFALLSLLRRPLDFDAVDDRPVDLVLLLLLPASQDAGGPGVLASAARRLRDPEIVAAMRAARSGGALAEAFNGR